MDLHRAAGFSRSLETVQTLVKNNANLHKYSTGGLIDELTPIIAATLGGQFDIIKYLLDQGADVNSQEKNTKSIIFAFLSFL